MFDFWHFIAEKGLKQIGVGVIDLGDLPYYKVLFLDLGNCSTLVVCNCLNEIGIGNIDFWVLNDKSIPIVIRYLAPFFFAQRLFLGRCEACSLTFFKHHYIFIRRQYILYFVLLLIWSNNYFHESSQYPSFLIITYNCRSQSVANLKHFV